MRFSIIIPVYNREYCIERCIKSVFSQKYDDYELIIVDDGSTDNTYSICSYLKKRNDRIKLISQTNSGVSSARNQGISASTGEYILFLDSDQIISTDALKSLDNGFFKNNYPDILCFGFESEKENNIWLPSNKFANKNYNKSQIRDLFLPEHINVKPQTEFFTTICLE